MPKGRAREVWHAEGLSRVSNCKFLRENLGLSRVSNGGVRVVGLREIMV